MLPACLSHGSRESNSTHSTFSKYASRRHGLDCTESKLSQAMFGLYDVIKYVDPINCVGIEQGRNEPLSLN